jgi:hypothetical protein
MTSLTQFSIVLTTQYDDFVASIVIVSQAQLEVQFNFALTQ